jgi:hypothetical protein
MGRRIGQNRSFGLLFAAFCFILAVLSYRADRETDIAWLIAAILFSVVSLAVPRVLAPLRRIWIKLGTLLGFVINPIVLGIAYVVTFIPVALLMRLFHRDALSRRRESGRRSYWIERRDGRITIERLKEQF